MSRCKQREQKNTYGCGRKASTWVHAELADVFTEVVPDSTSASKNQNEPIDLFMVKIMEMKQKSDTSLIRGLALYDGPLHPVWKKE